MWNLRFFLRVLDFYDNDDCICEKLGLMQTYWYMLFCLSLFPSLSCLSFDNFPYSSFHFCCLSCEEGLTRHMNDFDQLSYEWRNSWSVHCQWSHTVGNELSVSSHLLSHERWWPQCGLSFRLCFIHHLQHMNLVMMTMLMTDDPENINNTQCNSC